MTSTIKNYDYAFLNKINTVINRLENNHHSWYLVQITILLAYVTFFTWSLSNIEADNLLIASMVLTFSFLAIDILAIFNSFKYLWLGRKFRAVEDQYLKKQRESWDFSFDLIDNKKYKIKKINFTEIVQISFTIIILLLAISEILIIVV